MSTLLLICAGESSRHSGSPKWLKTHPEGGSMAERSVDWITGVDRLLVAVQSRHAAQYLRNDYARYMFGGAAQFIAIPPTASPVDTVRTVLSRVEVDDNFAVKDCDNRFAVALEDGNWIGVSRDPAPPNASYYHIRANSKKPSDMFCCGIYGFASVDEFFYMSEGRTELHECYIETTNRPVQVRAYEDYGTQEAWDRFCSLYENVFIDLDGVLLENAGNTSPIRWGENMPISENVDWLKQGKRRKVYITTARPECEREVTQRQLKDMGIGYSGLIMGLLHAQRTIIADHSASIRYPACRAISIERNSAICEHE